MVGCKKCVPRDCADLCDPTAVSRFKDLRENNLIDIASRFGSDLDGTIEKNSRPSTAMVRVFRLRPVQRRPEDWRDIVQVMFSQVLTRE